MRSWTREALAALASLGLSGEAELIPGGQIRNRMKRTTPPASRLPPFAPVQSVVEAQYRLLGTHALIRYSHRAQMRMVDTVIGHLKTEEAAPPTLTIDIHCQMWKPDWSEWLQMASDVYCDGKPEAQAERISSLGPLVKSALWLHAVNAHDFLLDLHAGVVGKDGRCICCRRPPAAASPR